jgi:hypothetical protein
MNNKNWLNRELPILKALLADDSEDGIDLEELERTLPILTHKDIVIGTRALVEGGFVVGIDASTNDGFDMAALRLSPRGRQEVGQWPSSTTSTDAVLQALEIVQRSANPAEKQALTRIKENVAAIGQGVMGNFVTTLVQLAANLGQ